jgi:hypothetical protein
VEIYFYLARNQFFFVQNSVEQQISVFCPFPKWLKISVSLIELHKQSSQISILIQVKGLLALNFSEKNWEYGELGRFRGGPI